ncbi:MAG: ANTAR domain-containing protein [Planctomycetaceae bacterium]|nr:ANTAR domain-containing protein [Planctomycetaceae bacterium]
MGHAQPTLASPGQIHASRLGFALWSTSPLDFPGDELSVFGLRQVARYASFAATSFDEPFDVLVVIASPDVVDDRQAELRKLIGAAIASQRGVCVVLHDDVATALELLAAGADSVAFLSESAPALAVAIYNAHNGGAVRRALACRVTELERKMEQTKLIHQAKNILAEQLKVSDAAAMRHLRHEARNQRRSMADIARVILESHRIMSRIANPQPERPAPVRRSAQFVSGKVECRHPSDSADDQPRSAAAIAFRRRQSG